MTYMFNTSNTSRRPTMAKASEIVRAAVHAFLRHFHPLSTSFALVIAPYSVALLLCASLSTSSGAFLTLRSRTHALLPSTALPRPFDPSMLLAHKLALTILVSAATLPLALTFLVFAKAMVVHIIYRRAPPSIGIYSILVKAQVCNYFAEISANFVLLLLLFGVFNLVGRFEFGDHVALGMSAAGVIVYSAVLAHVSVACNLAVVLAALDKVGGYRPLLKATLLMRGREATALSVSLPASLGMAAVQALFQHRIVTPYRASRDWWMAAAWEAPLIVSMHAVLVVLDVVLSCAFLTSCERGGLPMCKPPGGGAILSSSYIGGEET